jgi:hypothetical protein
MTPQTALIELLDRVGASLGAVVLVNDDELNRWPGAAVTAMKAQKLIKKASPAISAICPGCESECAMPVYALPSTAGASVSFIVCDKRSDVNRVPIAADRLTQWQCSMDSVCGFIATCLGLRHNNKLTDSVGLREIGIATGKKRCQMLCLQANGVLTLVAGNNKVPLAELIEFHDGKYSLDDTMICRLVDVATTADKRRTPSDVKRESRKLATKAVHESWKKEYSKLKKTHPNMSDLWYSKKIAKMPIANNCKAETIRKNMKM